MNFVKRFVALGSVLAMLSASVPAQAADCADTGGYCYEECRQASCLAPAIALGTIALVAIIAVAVQNSSHGHGHCHD